MVDLHQLLLVVCIGAAIPIGHGQFFPNSISSSNSCGCQQIYSVPLNNCGPQPCPRPVIPLSETRPCVQKPTVVLPSCIPSPKTISNCCHCQKTIVKPQVYRKTITVPSVQNVISTGYVPVTETINYIAVPRCCGCCQQYSSCGCCQQPPSCCGCQQQQQPSSCCCQQQPFGFADSLPYNNFAGSLNGRLF